MQKTVFVGLSGGVDSSVAALRLKQTGYRVVGVFIKVWHPDWMVCNWEQERLDAMRVAAHLDIPFFTCDAEAAYKQEVADYFIAEYTAGRTPNPDVMCNRAVKFGAFLQYALQKGADYVATGHYAQKTTDASQTHHLWRGVDENKDQTYFLWTLTQTQLAHVLLPVGDTAKEQIRKEAAAAGIPTAQKKDSQGICFLGHIDIPEFLSHYTTLTPGDVLDEHGTVIGNHRGALVYTIGQRHGFSITTTTASQTPHYVTGKNIETNTITVSQQPVTLPKTTSLTLTTLNQITPWPRNRELGVQFRYRQSPIAASITALANSTATLTLHEDTSAPAAGQSCVLFANNECLGGGIIG